MIDEKLLYQTLGERLRSLREQQNGARGRMTQAELASQIGLERTSITNIEKGVQKLPLHVLYRLCEALQVTVGELLPAVGEVQTSDGGTPLAEVTFGEQVVKAPPLTSQAIASILNTIEDANEPQHHRDD